MSEDSSRQTSSPASVQSSAASGDYKYSSLGQPDRTKSSKQTPNSNSSEAMVRHYHSAPQRITELTQTFSDRLKLLQDRVSSLSEDTNDTCSTLRSISNIQSCIISDENIKNDINNQIVTPRTLEVPPKRICLRPITPKIPKQKSIWTQRDNTRDAHLEPEVVVLESSGSTSSLEEVFSNPSNFSNPSCFVSSQGPEEQTTEGTDEDLEIDEEEQSVTFTELGNECKNAEVNIEMKKMKRQVQFEPNILVREVSFPNIKTGCSGDAELLEKFVTPKRPMTALGNTNYTVSHFNIFKKLFKMRKPKSSTTTKSEELEYFPDEMVINTINYSDYDVPVGKLESLPDVKSSKEIIDNLAVRVFKSKENLAQPVVEVDVHAEKPMPLSGFRKMANEIRKNRMVEENIGDGNDAFRFTKAIYERRPQILDLKYYDMEQIGDGNHSQEVFAKEASIKEFVDEEESEYEDSIEETTCCNLRFCSELLFPKRNDRYFY